MTELGCIPEDPISFAQKFYNVGLGVLGLISFLYILYGAYLITTSQGNPRKVADGKTYVFYAIAGLAFVLLIYLIIRLVAVETLNIPEFN